MDLVEKLGPCTVEFTPDGGSVMELNTIEDQDTVFTAPMEIAGRKFDQHIGIQQGEYVLTEAPTLTCAVENNPELLAGLTNAYVKGGHKGVKLDPITKELLFGAIKVHPLSAGDDTSQDIIGKRVFATVVPNKAMKKGGAEGSFAQVVFSFSSNIKEGDEDYRSPFTFGEYAEVDPA